MFQKQYAYWYQFFEGLPISTLDFYKSLEDGITTRRVPDTAATRVDFLEGGLLSSKRLYLQVRRDWLTYHVCVAPFGTGFFVSSRLLVSPFGRWPIMAALIAAAGLFLIILFAVVALLAKSGLTAFVVTSLFAFQLFWILAITIVLWIFLCLRLTYYRLDTMLAFHEAVHGLLVKQVNHVIEGSGRKPLTNDESKPILHKLLRR